MRFKSKKDISIGTIILGLNIFFIIAAILHFTSNIFERYGQLIAIIIITISGFVLWIYFGTNYELNKNQLIYKSGPFNGNVEIEKITEIISGKTLWAGFKPATARKGLIIKYNKFDEIYISPESNDSFIIEILKLNNNIKIVKVNETRD